MILAAGASTRQDSLLSVLAIAAERGMPLAPAVVAFADQYRGLSYRRIMDLAAQLNWGTMLPEALERSRKLVSRDAILLAWVGQAAGRLPRALRMAATTRSNQLPIWTAMRRGCLTSSGSCWPCRRSPRLSMYFIMPKFEAIFQRLCVVAAPGHDPGHRGCPSWSSSTAYLTICSCSVEIGLLVFLPLSFLSLE